MASVGNYFLLYSLHFGVRVHKAVSLQINYKEYGFENIII